MITLDKDKDLRAAVKKMVRGGLGALVITDDGAPVGILTERDVLTRFADGKLDPDGKVGTIMSTPLISVSANTTLGEASDVMLVNNIRRLLVKEDEKYIGIISQRELQRFITEAFDRSREDS